MLLLLLPLALPLCSTNGKEYITREHLREEVAGAVRAAGGRAPLVSVRA